MINKNKIDKSLLNKLAKLSRLEITDNSSEDLIKDLNNIIEFVDQLNEINTTDILPLSSVTGHELPMRIDKVSDGNIVDSILKNAPENASGFFVVPKVIE